MTGMLLLVSGLFTKIAAGWRGGEVSSARSGASARRKCQHRFSGARSDRGPNETVSPHSKARLIDERANGRVGWTVRSVRTPTIWIDCTLHPGVLAALAFAALGLLSPAALPAADGDILLREEFTSLEAWRPLTFPKIERHSTYSIATSDDQSAFWLKAESARSASGVVWKKQYDVYAYPKLRWRWRVENIYTKGDATKKSGDDYPVRVYVIFQYDPATASAGKRFKYGFAKAAYGEYPPDSGLNYVWESRDNPAEFVVSPYTDAMMMFLKEKGPAKVGQWVEEEADVLADYRKAFGTDPPRGASLAVMNDSDNTGEKAVSFIDWIEIGR